MPVDLSSAFYEYCAVTESSKQPIRQRFGKAIRRRRRELDISQEELAELAELHRTYISDVERGEVNPSLDNIEKLAAALNITISDLFIQYGIEVEDVI
nr:helix-turn-helix transcriptional regulator [Leptolyngbya sp. FACHB-541]